MSRAALVLSPPRFSAWGGTEKAGTAAGSCPRGMLALTDDALVRSIQVALDAEPRHSDAFATSAVIAAHDDPAGRAGQVRHRRRRRGLRRTVIVYFTRRAYLPARSASQGVSFGARFRSGYRVWERAH